MDEIYVTYVDYEHADNHDHDDNFEHTHTHTHPGAPGAPPIFIYRLSRTLSRHKQASCKRYRHVNHRFWNLLKESVILNAPELSKPPQMTTYTQNTFFIIKSIFIFFRNVKMGSGIIFYEKSVQNDDL